MKASLSRGRTWGGYFLRMQSWKATLHSRWKANAWAQTCMWSGFNRLCLNNIVAVALNMFCPMHGELSEDGLCLRVSLKQQKQRMKILAMERYSENSWSSGCLCGMFVLESETVWTLQQIYHFVSLKSNFLPVSLISPSSPADPFTSVQRLRYFMPG